MKIKHMIKYCKKCGAIKPLDEFGVDAGRKDGHSYSCKLCLRLAYKKRYKKIRTEELARARQYQKNNREKSAARARKYRSVNPCAARLAGKNWRLRNPEKQKAQNILTDAVRRGCVARATACEVCGITKNIHAHHDDYSKPLDVRWLCAIHHKQAHFCDDGREVMAVG